MSQETGKFTVSYADLQIATVAFEKDGILIGRLASCEIVLDHATVSRIHAGINFVDSKYFLINLSSSNVLTLNGRRLGPQKTDVLADGDTIQIGPFTFLAARIRDELLLIVDRQFADRSSEKAVGVRPTEASSEPVAPDVEGVLKVFWEKRTREKEDWGTRLRPTEKPVAEKAMFNWKPTRDLLPSWRFGLFLWAFLIIGAIGAFAFFRYPQTYASKPLASPHAAKIMGSTIAVTSNGNSCTTCHTLNEPVENSCIRCHKAEQFHASNTRAHEEAGITCTVCHLEHQGSDFQMRAAAVQGCATCHNDDNRSVYNGKTVRTPHSGSIGYPVQNGVWVWKGLYAEIAETVPGASSSATKDETEQARLSRQFHAVHVSRLIAPAGMTADGEGRVSCSSCHNSFDPIDRETPRETCAACHEANASSANSNVSPVTRQVNCVSCHVQHPYSNARLNEFLTKNANLHRRTVVSEQIRRLNGK